MRLEQFLTGCVAAPCLAMALGAVAVAAPPPDATTFHRVNMEDVADRLLGGEQPWLRKGERVWLSDSASLRAARDNEAWALKHMLMAALARRGIVFTASEERADVMLALSFPDVQGENLFFRQELLGVRPGPSWQLRDRLTVRAVDRATGRVRGEDYLVSEYRPFEGGTAVPASEASGTASPSVPDLGSVQAELTGYGLSVSWLSGSGFAWRRWLSDGWGWQLAGIPYSDGTDYFHNAGGQVMRQLFEGRPGRLYLLGAVGAAYGTTGPTGWDQLSDDGRTYNRQPTLLWNLSAGLGADLRLSPNFVVALGAGYSLSPRASIDASYRVRTESVGVTPAFSAGTFLEF